MKKSSGNTEPKSIIFNPLNFKADNLGAREMLLTIALESPFHRVIFHEDEKEFVYVLVKPEEFKVGGFNDWKKAHSYKSVLEHVLPGVKVMLKDENEHIGGDIKIIATLPEKELFAALEKAQSARYLRNTAIRKDAEGLYSARYDFEIQIPTPEAYLESKGILPRHGRMRTEYTMVDSKYETRERVEFNEFLLKRKLGIADSDIKRFERSASEEMPKGYYRLAIKTETLQQKIASDTSVASDILRDLLRDKIHKVKFDGNTYFMPSVEMTEAQAEATKGLVQRHFPGTEITILDQEGSYSRNEFSYFTNSPLFPPVVQEGVPGFRYTYKRVLVDINSFVEAVRQQAQKEAEAGEARVSPIAVNTQGEHELFTSRQAMAKGKEKIMQRGVPIELAHNILRYVPEYTGSSLAKKTVKEMAQPPKNAATRLESRRKTEMISQNSGVGR